MALGILIILVIIALVASSSPTNTSPRMEQKRKSDYHSYLAGKVGRTVGKSLVGRGRRRWRL